MSLFKRLFGKNKKQDENEQEVVQIEEKVEALTSDIEDEDSSEVVEDLKHEAREKETQSVEEVQCKNAELADRMMDNTEVEPQRHEAEMIEEIVPVIQDEAYEEDDSEEVSEMIPNLGCETAPVAVDEQDKVEDVGIIEEQVPTMVEEPPIEEEIQEKKGFIKRLFSGLSKTRDSILKGVDDVLSNFKHIDEELYEELEEALIMADFGVDTTLHIMKKLKEKVKEDKMTDPSGLKSALQEIITNLLTEQPTEDILNPEGPTVVLVIGVNGVGKTTSIGKMSHLFKSQHKKVLVAAADTFRAAAIEQLNIWTNRAGVEIIKHEEGSDAAAVVFDAITAAKSRKSDVLICDTAGRLQNKTNLMKELEKISRIIAREYPEAKKEILIVIDATTGQNAIQQVKLFKEVADISGIILTKLDGTAKGGAIVGIYESLKVPVKYIGVGEKIDDLQPFDAEAFAKALFAEEA